MDELDFTAIDDEATYLAARDKLLNEHHRWLRSHLVVPRRVADELADDAEIIVDWKVTHGDGRVGHWTERDVTGFLLEWCPNSLEGGLDLEQAAALPAAVGAFTDFLDRTDRLAPGSLRASEVMGIIEGLGDDYLKAMAEQRNLNAAKALIDVAIDDGVEPSDVNALAEWARTFNALPFEARRRMLPDHVKGPPPRADDPLTLPPLPMPPADEVRQSIAAAPILHRLAGFVDYVASGRRLTAKGNLRLADARELVELLDTGDRVDPTVQGRACRTRSTIELLGLRQVFVVAREADLVRVIKGKVVATERGLALRDDPVAHYDEVIDVLMELGPVSSQRDPSHWLGNPELDRALDQATLPLLARPYTYQGSVKFGNLVQLAQDVVTSELAALDAPDYYPHQIAWRIDDDVADLVESLVVAGLVVRQGNKPDRGPEGLLRRTFGGRVGLTPAGVVTTRRLLTAAGYVAPEVGALADATAMELLLGSEGVASGQLVAEVAAWRSRRSEAAAVREMADAAAAIDDPVLQNLALAIISDVRVETAAPVIAQLADSIPALRGWALCWLVDNGWADEEQLFDPDEVWWFVDVLANRLFTVGPDAMCAILELAGNHDAQRQAIDGMTRSPSAMTDSVLVALGTYHPAKVVAKAARKARVRRRGWLASS